MRFVWIVSNGFINGRDKCNWVLSTFIFNLSRVS